MPAGVALTLGVSPAAALYCYGRIEVQQDAWMCQRRFVRFGSTRSTAVVGIDEARKASSIPVYGFTLFC